MIGSRPGACPTGPGQLIARDTGSSDIWLAGSLWMVGRTLQRVMLLASLASPILQPRRHGTVDHRWHGAVTPAGWRVFSAWLFPLPLPPCGGAACVASPFSFAQTTIDPSQITCCSTTPPFRCASLVSRRFLSVRPVSVNPATGAGVLVYPRHPLPGRLHRGSSTIKGPAPWFLAPNLFGLR